MKKILAYETTHRLSATDRKILYDLAQMHVADGCIGYLMASDIKDELQPADLVHDHLGCLMDQGWVLAYCPPECDRNETAHRETYNLTLPEELRDWHEDVENRHKLARFLATKCGSHWDPMEISDFYAGFDQEPAECNCWDSAWVAYLMDKDT